MSAPIILVSSMSSFQMSFSWVSSTKCCFEAKAQSITQLPMFDLAFCKYWMNSVLERDAPSMMCDEICDASLKNLSIRSLWASVWQQLPNDRIALEKSTDL